MIRRNVILQIAALALSAVAHGATTRTVLILHGGAPSVPATVIVADEIHRVLTSDSSLDVRMFDEYIENDRLGEDLDQEAKSLEIKYAGHAPDLILLDGVTAFTLVHREGSRFFTGVPIVFLAVTEDALRTYGRPPDSTGVTGGLDIRKTAEMAAALQPDLKHLYVVFGTAEMEQQLEKAARWKMQSFVSNIDVEYLHPASLDDLLKTADRLPPHSAFLFGTMIRAQNGEINVPAKVAEVLAGVANVPVYAALATYMGGGPVGGAVVDFRRFAHHGAVLALQILHGADAASVPIETLKNETEVDWRQMRRFNLPMTRLPTGTTVLYQPPSVWRRFFPQILFAAIIIVVEGLLILRLLAEVRRRRSSELSARRLAHRLISAQDEEQKRIARDLHDDFSQRLALACMKIDSLRGFPNSAQCEELDDIYDDLDQLTTDLHNLSRQLHSGILDRLGLVVALRRHILDFHQRTGIRVDLLIAGEEYALTSPVAQTLFRVAQEALRNVAKHSGAQDAIMSLHYASGKIDLSIVDGGRGFAPEQMEETSGIGIAGMRERVASIGGEFRIDSAPSRGITIAVSVPTMIQAMCSGPTESAKLQTVESEDAQATNAMA